MTEKDAIEKLLFILLNKELISNADEKVILEKLKLESKKKQITIAKNDKGFHCNAIVPEDKLEDFLKLLAGIMKVKE